MGFNKSKITVAIVGATGLVGMEAIKLLENNDVFKNIELKLFASKRSVGKSVTFRNKSSVIKLLDEDSFKFIDLAIFSIESNLSKKYIPTAIENGCIVIDNSSAFRMNQDVPLVIPEINGDDINRHNGLISNPNCTTIIFLMAIYPIYKLSRVNKICLSSYQAVSGAGIKAYKELDEQIKAYAVGTKIVPKKFKHQILMNVFSHESEVQENGYNLEEQKAINETKKILNDHNLQISPTCIRVPVIRSHSVSISIITEKKLKIESVKEAMQNFRGVSLVDDPEQNIFPTPIEASNRNDVLVGRIRRGMTHENEILMFACGDQLLKGAALNAVQIAERLM